MIVVVVVGAESGGDGVGVEGSDLGCVCAMGHQNRSGFAHIGKKDDNRGGRCFVSATSVGSEE